MSYGVHKKVFQTHAWTDTQTVDNTLSPYRRTPGDKNYGQIGAFFILIVLPVINIGIQLLFPMLLINGQKMDLICSLISSLDIWVGLVLTVGYGWERTHLVVCVEFHKWNEIIPLCGTWCPSSYCYEPSWQGNCPYTLISWGALMFLNIEAIETRVWHIFYKHVYILKFTLLK